MTTALLLGAGALWLGITSVATAAYAAPFPDEGALEAGLRGNDSPDSCRSPPPPTMTARTRDRPTETTTECQTAKTTVEGTRTQGRRISTVMAGEMPAIVTSLEMVSEIPVTTALRYPTGINW